ncbi:ABC transporter ATP-binding protein [Salinisphaera sp. Q1T1-3]|uniref:ABC transporter ATP-binding protein n=1 Tax=Salinisphaera sp. Q1T1-3 TaxID=2321229 RepID=UPI000E748C75|nr:ATP-binding cassette domain-containing protein [Salinisphaera sp. Q1T1-3]RJS93479.1 ATP-binding cassette domain-containing protein [Salinisphaera sp. Q1T1-3]
MSIPYAIQANNIAKTVTSGHQTLTILEALDLAVAVGERLAIVGTSGSGKSSLLALLAGLDVPSAGTITLLGRDLAGLDEDARAAWRAGRVGFVFQSFQLLDGLSAQENVMLALELAGTARPAARERAATLLADVGLTARAGHTPRQLSGGEQQRVALARAFACQPDLLFADEPTGNLDRATGEQVIERLFAMNTAHGTTLVLVTHDDTLAARCDRCLRLVDGRLVADHA